MSDDRCGSGTAVVLAFVSGALVGAGLALLYAPMTGRETREKITGLAGDLKHKAEDWTGSVKEKVTHFIDEEKSVVKAAYEAGRDAMAKERDRFTTPTT